MPEVIEGRFKFAGLNMVKAFDHNGKPAITIQISDTRHDRQDEQMLQPAIDDMERQCKAGTVLLLPSHHDTFEMGKSFDGRQVKAQDGHTELLADFDLYDSHPFTPILHGEIAAGTCKRQASVGGMSKGTKVFDASTNKVIKQITGVPWLEHVACTRANMSAVSSAGMVAAMFKGLDFDQVPDPQSIKKESSTVTLEEQLAAAQKTIGDMTTIMAKSVANADNGFDPAKAAGAVNKVEELTKTGGELETIKTALGAVAAKKDVDELSKSVIALTGVVHQLVTSMGQPQGRGGNLMTKGSIPTFQEMVDSMLKGGDGNGGGSGSGGGAGGSGGGTGESDMEKEVKTFKAAWEPMMKKIKHGIPLTDAEEASRSTLALQRMELQAQGADV